MTGSIQKEISALIETGRFQNMSEAIRACARMLIDKEAQRSAVIKRLEAAVDEALESGIVENFEVDDFIAKKTNNGRANNL